jgi:hypothetical protein
MSRVRRAYRALRRLGGGHPVELPTIFLMRAYMIGDAAQPINTPTGEPQQVGSAI